MKTKLQHEYVRSNKLNNGQLLVVFMYNAQEEIRLLRMYPQSLLADCTHGTNSERKELFTITGVDGNSNAYKACRAYVPSLQSWVFELLFCQHYFLETQFFSSKTSFNRWCNNRICFIYSKYRA